MSARNIDWEAKASLNASIACHATFLTRCGGTQLLVRTSALGSACLRVVRTVASGDSLTSEAPSNELSAIARVPSTWCSRLVWAAMLLVVGLGRPSDVSAGAQVDMGRCVRQARSSALGAVVVKRSPSAVTCTCTPQPRSVSTSVLAQCFS